MRADLVVRNIGSLATLAGPVPRVGALLRDLAVVEDAALASAGGRITFAGSAAELPPEAVGPATEVVDAGGGWVLPGFVDAHTHLAFAGSRDEEIRQRLAGISYKEIAAAGGGIVRTVTATRAASEGELVEAMRRRLDEMLRQGTTTAEVKSGYGLTPESELRSLQAIAHVAATHPVRLVPTFLGAHEVPVEHRGNRARYLELVIQDMIPEVAHRKLATFCDVFCEDGVFTVEESRRVLVAGLEHGLLPRVHADELGWTGGAELAAEVGARSADHLVFVSEAGILALARARCAATLLPTASFYLRLPRFAPARALVDGGVPVALATDVNPGGGLSPSLPFAMAIACFSMGLALEEAVAAVTVNGAYSVGLEDEVGRLVPGLKADLVILRSGRLLDLVRVGVPSIRTVIKDGRVVVDEGARA